MVDVKSLSQYNIQKEATINLITRTSGHNNPSIHAKKKMNTYNQLAQKHFKTTWWTEEASDTDILSTNQALSIEMTDLLLSKAYDFIVYHNQKLGVEESTMMRVHKQSRYDLTERAKLLDDMLIWCHRYPICMVTKDSQASNPNAVTACHTLKFPSVSELFERLRQEVPKSITEGAKKAQFLLVIRNADCSLSKVQLVEMDSRGQIAGRFLPYIAVESRQ